ncbi:MAG: porphobilinogen synthase, partial [Desulfobulbaceae bacterium]|nr:porphobilinogen synthase [Desulfobulbaceae bacterium]
MVFPEYRPRRMRQNEIFRSMVREITLSADHLIYPLFVQHGKNIRDEVSSMPGVFRISVDQLANEAKECMSLGINNVILFGLPEKKDAVGSGAHARDGIIQRAIKELKNKAPEMNVTTDVCLCEYTDHGHCGIIIDKQVDNDSTLEVLAKTALSHAEAGADMVAPSDMMDG